MYTRITGQYWIKNFFWYVDYPIGNTYQLNEENQATTKILLSEYIALKTHHINVLVNTLHEYHLQNIFEVMNMDTRLQLQYFNLKQYGGKNLLYVIDCAIIACFYPPH